MAAHCCRCRADRWTARGTDLFSLSPRSADRAPRAERRANRQECRPQDQTPQTCRGCRSRTHGFPWRSRAAPNLEWSRACTSWPRLMSRCCCRIVALGLILLGVSPFTAPFSTCDLASLHARTPPASTDAWPPGQDGWFKPATDPDKLPVLGVLAPTMTLVEHAATMAVPLRERRPLLARVPRAVLRI